MKKRQTHNRKRNANKASLGYQRSCIAAKLLSGGETRQQPHHSMADPKKQSPFYRECHSRASIDRYLFAIDPQSSSPNRKQFLEQVEENSNENSRELILRKTGSHCPK